VNAEKIASDLQLTQKDAELLVGYSENLEGANSLEIEAEIERLMDAPELRDASHEYHAFTKAALLLAVDRRENPEGQTSERSSLPRGVKSAADLMDVAPDRQALEDVKTSITEHLNKGESEDSEIIKELRVVEADTLERLGNTSQLSVKHNAMIAEQTERHEAQVQAADNQQMQGFFKRRRESNSRLSIVPSKESDLLIAQEWSRFKNGY